MTRILIMDDHGFVREGIRQFMQIRFPNSEIIEAGEAEKALNHLRSCFFDIFIADLQLKDQFSYSLIKTVRFMQSTLKIIIISMHDSAQSIDLAFKNGADGFVSKLEPPDELLNAVQVVMGNKRFLSSYLSERFIDLHLSLPSNDPSKRLSDKEYEIFTLLGECISPRFIADRLGISLSTVETHMSRIKKKMGFENGRQLLSFAICHAQERNSTFKQ